MFAYRVDTLGHQRIDCVFLMKQKALLQQLLSINFGLPLVTVRPLSKLSNFALDCIGGFCFTWGYYYYVGLFIQMVFKFIPELHFSPLTKLFVQMV